MGNSGGSLAVAIVALVVSLLSLGWNVFNTFFRLPRVHTLLSKHVRITVVFSNSEPPRQEGDPEYKFGVTAINTGSEATTVADAGLMLPSGGILASVVHLRGQGVEVPGPDLPCRLEEHGALTWVVPGSAPDVLQYPDGEPMFGYVQQYRPQGRRRSKGGIHRSPRAEVKGAGRS